MKLFDIEVRSLLSAAVSVSIFVLEMAEERSYKQVINKVGKEATRMQCK